jgi:hypothetical protein
MGLFFEWYLLDYGHLKKVKETERSKASGELLLVGVNSGQDGEG